MYIHMYVKVAEFGLDRVFGLDQPHPIFWHSYAFFKDYFKEMKFCTKMYKIRN